MALRSLLRWDGVGNPDFNSPYVHHHIVISSIFRSTANSGYADNWNAFGCGLSQSLILGTANFVLSTGLRDLGYHYIILDDCWSSGRTSSGVLIPDANKFPNGMSYLGNQLHAQGFGFGIYSSAGTKTVSCDSSFFKSRHLTLIVCSVCWIPRQLRLRDYRCKHLGKLGS